MTSEEVKMGKKGQSFSSRLANLGAPKKNRGNKSTQAKQQSAARVAKQQTRGSSKFTSGTHHDSLKGGGNSGGKKRR